MTLKLFVKPLDHMSDWVLLKVVEKKSPNLASHVACTNCFYTPAVTFYYMCCTEVKGYSIRECCWMLSNLMLQT